ncbi:MAG TPA: YggS family pyridoxal phosphate-dependent enzyme [Acidimicrobiales bacterium]|nr:YggS family pyridoxal phosphate-dependent enzyme [Acidimicrobiales bacterium]
MTTFPASFADAELVARVAQNLTQLRARIATTGRDPETVRIVAVTKTFGVETVRAALANGLRHVGENYVDELETKYAQSRDLEISWHFLGALQSNKIARVCAHAQVVSTVSRTKELEKIAATNDRPQLYVQVDYTGGATRNGAAASEVPELLRRARNLELDIRGLMTVAAPDEAQARSAFAKLSALRVDQGLVECSMGMSDDLEIACELGTTELRIGRALFGQRDPHSVA